MNPYFSSDEYEHRYERACQFMKNQKVDVMLITSETNIYYLSGYQAFQPWYSTTRPTILLFPCDKKPILITSRGYSGAAERDSWVNDIRIYDGISTDIVSIVIEAIEELGLKSSRIGVEIGNELRIGITLEDYKRILELLDDAVIVDVASLIWDLRIIKSKREIDCIQKSCHAVNMAYATVFPEISSNISEENLVYKIHSAIANSGADPGFVFQVSNRELYKRLTSLPSSSCLKDGNLITVDAGARYHGYWCDFARGAFIGQPSDEILKTWESIHQVTMKGLEVVKPGVSIGEIVAMCAREAEILGLELSTIGGRIGHGIGLMFTEPPSIILDNKTPMEAGMVLALEPSIKNSLGYFVSEQNFVVTDNGYDLLTTGQWQIWLA